MIKITNILNNNKIVTNVVVDGSSLPMVEIQIKAWNDKTYGFWLLNKEQTAVLIKHLLEHLIEL